MNVPLIVTNGPDWYKTHGTEQSTGTKVVSVSGCVQRPGNYEIELGIPSREIIFDLAGGPSDGHSVKAWFPGGSSAPVLTADDLDLPYSFEAMADAGSMLGSGRSSSPTRPSRSPTSPCGPRASTTTSRAASAPPAARAPTGR